MRNKKHKDKGHYKSVLYGIWDHTIKDWVINTEGIGLDKAKKILKALDQPRKSVRRKNFWEE